MNLPIGKPVFEREHDVISKMEEVIKYGFNGYVALTIHSGLGMEDSALIFRDGKAVASFYEFLNFKKTIFAESALRGFLNALKSNNAIADCYALASHQIDLILAFNEHLKFKRSLNFLQLKRLLPKQYDSCFSYKILNIKKEETRAEILRRFGLEKL